MADPESDLLDILNTDGTYTEDTNLFRGPVLPTGTKAGTKVIPKAAVFVRFVTGSPPLRLSDGNNEEDLLLDVIVRGEPMKYGTARSEAQRLLDLVHGSSPPSGYFDIRCQTSHPQWIDRDGEGSDLLVFTVRMRRLD